MSGALFFAGVAFPMAASSGGRPKISAVAPTVAPAKGRNFYEVLRVREAATDGEIKAAYRSMAKRFHPDVAPACQEEFLEIQRAYETLSDAAARARYDIFIGRRLPAPGFVVANRVGSRRWETDQCW